MSIKLVPKYVEVGEKVIHGALLEMENAVVSFIWEGDNPRLGTTTITLPDKTSTQVIGERDVIVSNMIGERLALKYGKLALVSTNLPKDFIIDKQIIVLVDKLTGAKS